jgi:hypothetical protein
MNDGNKFKNIGNNIIDMVIYFEEMIVVSKMHFP